MEMSWKVNRNIELKKNIERQSSKGIRIVNIRDHNNKLIIITISHTNRFVHNTTTVYTRRTT